MYSNFEILIIFNNCKTLEEWEKVTDAFSFLQNNNYLNFDHRKVDFFLRVAKDKLNSFSYGKNKN